MTKKKTVTAAVEVAPVIFGPDNGGNAILAGWQGLYHLFGARVERFDITPEGIFAVNPTVDEKYDIDRIVENLIVHNGKTINRRLDFLPLFFWATGQIPTPFSTSAQLTTWLTQFLKGTGDKGRSPKYAKDAIGEYKVATGIYVTRGRPRKTIKLSEIGEIDEASLEGVDFSEITKLRETLDTVISRNSEAVLA